MINHEAYNTALANRFSVIYGAADEFEKEVCVSLVLMLPAILVAIHQDYKERAMESLMGHLRMCLVLHKTPPERIRDLCKAVLSETLTHLKIVLGRAREESGS